MRDSELAQDARLVEVDPLATDAIIFEQEERRHTTAERAAGSGQRAQRAEVGAKQIELGDQRVVRVVKGDELVALVRKRGPGLSEVATDLGLTIEDVPRCNDLVAGVRKGRDRRIEVVVVLGLHVLAHHGLSALTQSAR